MQTITTILMPKKVVFFLVLWLICFVFIFWPSKEEQNETFSHKSKSPKSLHPLLIWWKPMLGLGNDYVMSRYCGVYKCTFTSRRDNLKTAAAILYYGSEFDVVDLPLPRLPHHIWALLHEESPRNAPYMPNTNFLQHFNYTSTLSRHSDFPLTTIHLNEATDLTTPKYLVPIGEKTRLQQEEKLAPIVFLQSDCDTPSERDTYVKELMRYIKVDSYGACLHNRNLPGSLRTDYLDKLYSPELYRFLARYKFILAYENGVCHDYITEKFWRPLVVGSIPVYFGSPSIKDWEPNGKSVVHIRDFPSPKALADYLLSINANDSEYNTFLQHKYNLLQPITNQRLQQELMLREYSPSMNPNIMGLFECFICSQLHENKSGKQKKASVNHFDCPYPPIYPPMSTDPSENYYSWKSIMAVGKCQAEVIDELLKRNLPYSRQHFQNRLDEKIKSDSFDL